MLEASSQCVIWFIYNNGDMVTWIKIVFSDIFMRKKDLLFDFRYYVISLDFNFLRVHSYSILITCSLNPKLQSRFGALNDLVNSIQVIEPFQNGSSVGTRIGKQFFGSYDATDNR